MATKLCHELLTAIFEECLQAGPVDTPAAGARSSHADACKPDERTASPHGTVCSATRVCRKWYNPATKALYADPGPAISRSEGYNIHKLLASLQSDKFLRDSVRALTITASLEGGLWGETTKTEGDLFCDLVELCPRLKAITLPSFERDCRSRIVAALKACTMMESFNIRVYLESTRRNSRLKGEICYDSWKLEIISKIMASWPKLKSFTVRHIPDNSYHLIPDIVLEPPRKHPYTLPAHNARLTTLALRETFIDDQGLFHLLNSSTLTSLTLMSCQGITSSAITRQGLLKALEICGPTLRDLTLMTPWLPHSARPGEPDYVVDRGIKFCTRLRSLCVAGYDVTKACIKNLPNPSLLETLEIMDFEHISPQIIFEICCSKKGRRYPNLKQLAVWQRNAGVGRARVSNGWFKPCFGKANSPAIAALEQAGIRLATGWESRLISGSPIDFIEPHRTASVFEELDRLSPV